MNPSDEHPVPNHLTALRDDVAETSQVLKLTVEKLVQRGDNLDALNAQAEHLNSSSYHFQGSSRRLNRRMRNQNYKLNFFIGQSISALE